MEDLQEAAARLSLATGVPVSSIIRAIEGVQMAFEMITVQALKVREVLRELFKSHAPLVLRRVPDDRRLLRVGPRRDQTPVGSIRPGGVWWGIQPWKQRLAWSFVPRA